MCGRGRCVRTAESCARGAACLALVRAARSAVSAAAKGWLADGELAPSLLTVRRAPEWPPATAPTASTTAMRAPTTSETRGRGSETTLGSPRGGQPARTSAPWGPVCAATPAMEGSLGAGWVVAPPDAGTPTALCSAAESSDQNRSAVGSGASSGPMPTQDSPRGATGTSSSLGPIQFVGNRMTLSASGPVPATCSLCRSPVLTGFADLSSNGRMHTVHPSSYYTARLVPVCLN